MRARRWPAILILFLVLRLFQVSALEGGGFTEANRLYEQAKYAEAIEAYEALTKGGKVSAALLFNLANACFKHGELGRAIFNYRRAAMLAPRDPDIQANLGFARDRITGSASVQEPAWERVFRYFKLNEFAVVASLSFWFFFALLGVIRWRPALQTTLRPYVLASGILLLVAVAFLFLAYRLSRTQVAIAVQRPTVVRLGPLTESQEAFTVPDGTELSIENRRDDWLQVSDRSSRTGWIESNRVLVVP